MLMVYFCWVLQILNYWPGYCYVKVEADMGYASERVSAQFKGSNSLIVFLLL